MNLHEYQAKEILRKYGIETYSFGVASSKDEIERVINELGLEKAVIKVQVHAGGRGKAGGVAFANSREEILPLASKLLGMKITNEQTGKEGLISEKVLIAPPTDIKKEFYLGIVIDREKATPMLIASPEGGIDIEEIAKTKPDRILTLPVPFDGVLQESELIQISKFMGWDDVAQQGMKVAANLAKAFIDSDATLFEINPLAETKDGKIVALDAKLNIDDDALFRQKELSELYDSTQSSPLEVKAKEYDLSYISLDGNIGCMVNGAGLAMATMDIISHYGGQPANFLDVGGGATKEKVAAGFEIILSDPKVKAILINIFGGIMNCATIAEGLLEVSLKKKLHIPLVVRLEGTNSSLGKKILQDSGLQIIAATNFDDAAHTVVKYANPN